MPLERTSATFTSTQVAKHNTEHDCWVVHRGRVYDISLFLHDHPGGPEFILEYAGKDIDTVMRDVAIHDHSEGAYDILDDYFIGRLQRDSNSHMNDLRDDASDSGADVTHEGSAISLTNLAKYRDPKSELDKQLSDELTIAKRPLLDLNKPLLDQMLNATFSKEYYLEQVHIPRHLPEPATIFANPVLELLTRSPWYLVPITWIPVVTYLVWESLHYMSLEQWFGLFLMGLVIWTFFEYTFHRFLFHVDRWLPDHRYALTLHFLMHGIHHYLPMDRMRLVLPPAFFAIIVQPPWWSFRLIFSYPICIALFSGGIAGYIAYDLTHYYLHHASVRTSYLRDMKKYHLAHHYKNYELGYGITSKIWDHVFSTLL